MTKLAFEAEVAGLGDQGDGFAMVEGVRRYVPLTAPGDRLRFDVSGVVQIVPAGLRQKPPCPHFGRCGGCRLQHLAHEPYRKFKRSRLVSALDRAGFDAEITKDLLDASASGRRRVDWAVRVEKGVVTIGFHALRSDEIIGIGPCPVSAPEIEALIAPLARHLAGLKKPGRVRGVSATLFDAGIDLSVTLTDMPPPRDRAAWLEFCEIEGLVRLSFTTNGSGTVFERDSSVAVSGTAVRPPVGAFLQATKDGENFLATSVLRYLAGRRRIVDLYSGMGTFALPLLSAGHEVSAFEGGRDMVETLWNAAQANGWNERLRVEVRDLHLEPVPAETLMRFDAAIVNPPRNGAEQQFRQLAQVRLPVVAVVSCDPATFSRDVVHLREAGYALDEAVPVDQFRWSPHVEIVARFSLPGQSPVDRRAGSVAL